MDCIPAKKMMKWYPIYCHIPGIITENRTTPGSVSQFKIHGLEKVKSPGRAVDKVGQNHGQRKLNADAGHHAFYGVEDYFLKIPVSGKQIHKILDPYESGSCDSVPL